MTGDLSEYKASAWATFTNVHGETLLLHVEGHEVLLRHTDVDFPSAVLVTGPVTPVVLSEEESQWLAVMCTLRAEQLRWSRRV